MAGRLTMEEVIKTASGEAYLEEEVIQTPEPMVTQPTDVVEYLEQAKDTMLETLQGQAMAFADMFADRVMSRLGPALNEDIQNTKQIEANTAYEEGYQAALNSMNPEPVLQEGVGEVVEEVPVGPAAGVPAKTASNLQEEIRNLKWASELSSLDLGIIEETEYSRARREMEEKWG